MSSVELAWDDAEHRASSLRFEWSGNVTVGEALALLPRENVPPLLDGQPLDPAAELGQVAWRRGAVFGGSDRFLDPTASEHIRVVGGPRAGFIAPLEDASRLQPELGLSRAGDGVWVQPRPGLDARYEGVPISSRRLWQAGDVVQVGTTLVSWHRGMSRPEKATSTPTPHERGQIGFARSPRILPTVEPPDVSVPTPPRPPPRRPLPWLVALAPLVVGVGLFVVTGSAYTLLFSVLSPVLLLGSWWSDRRATRGQHREATAEYAESVRRMERRLAELVAEESHRLREQTPDPAALLLQSLGPRPGLWQRRRGDIDHLDLTVGVGDLPAAVRLHSEGARNGRSVPLLPYVPVSLPLRSLGVVGLCGHRPHVVGLARWWVGQTAGSSSPRDVRLVVLSVQPSAVEDWAWARWLPHTGSDAGDAHAGQSLVAVDRPTAQARLDELSALVDQRAAIRSNGPDYVLLLDGAAKLRTEPACARLLADGPAVGVYVICLDDVEPRLPEECQGVVTADDSAFVTVRSTGRQDAGSVLAHQVSAAWADQLAHALAPLVDATPTASIDHVIPTSARLLSLLGLDPPSAVALLERWATSSVTTVAQIGVGADGPLEVDLRADGPHALVAGTTGAGKSELLQSLVASLAAANRPDAMTFLLVDYKGGAAFGECARLPHTFGLVTDLDAALTSRALESLTAELRRRETLLGDAGAKDLEAYAAAGNVAGPLPRLVIVVDEFASLVEELPDFVHGLVGIAQRGRSLGVHLVLATQRPSGVVSPEIRANTNLRIALRVTDDAESLDVLNAPDAARIPRSLPGRAYVRTGHGELHPFQTARVAGPAPRRPVSAEARSLRVDVLDVSALGQPRSGASSVGPNQTTGTTDLMLFVDAVRDASLRAQVEAPPPPWLPPLPAVLPWSAMDAPGAFGLEDRPDVQRQPPAVVGDGHLLVAGVARSGRTTLLRTLAVSLASASTVDSMHLYAIDGGNGPLADIAQLPHVGAVVAATEPGRVDRLLSRLAVEVGRRQELGGAADEAALVLLVDRWESFVARYDDVDGGRLVDLLLDLVRDGLSVGLRLVITGDRSLLVGRLAGLVDDKVCLRMAEVGDYALAGLDPRRVSLDGPAGRGYRAPSGVELQVAMSTPSDLRAVIDSAKAPERQRPFRIDPIPRSLRLDEAEALPWAGPGRVLVGVGGDDLMRVGVDLARAGPGFVVTGPRRSGRSTALVTMAYSALMSDARVVAVAPRGGPLLALPADERIPAGRLTLLTGRNGGGDASAPGAGPSGSGIDTKALIAAVQDGGGSPVVVVVDDAERLKDVDVAAVLGDVLRKADRGLALVIAAATDDLSRAVRGYLNDVRSSRSGLLLTPDTHLMGELLGVHLPRSAAFRVPVGRGLLVVDGEVTMVQVPLPHVLVRP
ncbi:MAG: FtsK/SpoIIIE domain-containing protein [Candidatus Nanopelagicales bacterium]